MSKHDWLFKDLATTEEAAPKIVDKFLFFALNQLFEAQKQLSLGNWRETGFCGLAASGWIFALESRISKEHKEDRKRLQKARNIIEEIHRRSRRIGAKLRRKISEEDWKEISNAIEDGIGAICELLGLSREHFYIES